MLKACSTKFEFGKNRAYSMIYSSLTGWPPELVFTIFNIVLNVTVTESSVFIFGDNVQLYTGTASVHVMKDSPLLHWPRWVFESNLAVR